MVKMFLEDAFIDLDRAENHAHALKDENLGIHEYEEHFDQFLRYINSAWEKSVHELVETMRDDFRGDIDRDASEEARKSDPLIHYIKVARDQLSHRQGVLWHSGHGKPPIGAGRLIQRGGSYLVRDRNSYAAAVLPTLSFNFVGGETALVGIMERVKGELVPLPVPTMHRNKPLESNDPTTSVLLTLEYYGKILTNWANKYREKWIPPIPN